MGALRMMILLSALGGAVSTAVMWPHEHPHEMWSVWTLSDLVPLALMVLVLRLVHRRIVATPLASRLSAVLAKSTSRTTS